MAKTKGIRNGRKAMLLWIKLDAHAEIAKTAEEMGMVKGAKDGLL